MLKKAFKLNTSEFKEVFNFGKTIKTPLGIIKYKKGIKKYPRFAVVVSKKISKKATERNYQKRRVFAAIKECYSVFGVFDYILILNSEIKSIQYKDLITEFKNIKINSI
jgi:ribonuclease P protein component